MTLPIHKNPQTADRTATAAYNFIPLPERLVEAVGHADELPGHDAFQAETYSGYFDVKLATQTPLYIRGALTRSEFNQMEQQGQDGTGQQEARQTDFQNRIKNKPDFFHISDGNSPVIPGSSIPGSSLRGMLRALVEIISHGKFDRVSDRKLIYRAVGDATSLGAWYRQQFLGENQSTDPAHIKLDYPLQRKAGTRYVAGGYLERLPSGDWAIRPAKTIHGETVAHVEYTAAEAIGIFHGAQSVHDVYLAPPKRGWNSRPGLRNGKTLHLNLAVVAPAAGNISRTPRPGLSPAKLIVSGHMGGQHEKHMHCAVYEKDATAGLIAIEPDLWQIYWDDLALPRGNLATRKLSVGDPLFYLVDEHGQLVFFGSTMMFRLPYLKNPKTIHGRIPHCLRKPLAIDYADAIFGFVRNPKDFEANNVPKQGDKARAYASRVFVEDAVLEPGQTDLWWHDEPITPKIMASPKPTCFQHYLVQESIQKVNGDKTHLSHYDSPTRDDTGALRGSDSVIRGHKRYWYHANAPTLGSVQDISASPNSTQHTRIKPLRPDVVFKFRIRFENLRRDELGALCWALHPVGNPATEYRHSLGMGKALGLGKVKLDARLVLTDRAARYQSLFKDSGWASGEGTAQSLDKLAEAMLQNGIDSVDTPAGFAWSFEKRMLLNLGDSSTSRLAAVGRIRHLLRMLEDRGIAETAASTMTLPEFKQRRVLPDVLHVSGEPPHVARPSGPVGAGSGQHGRQPPHSPTASAPASAPHNQAQQANEAERIRNIIQSLRGAGEASRLPAIIGQINAISDADSRRDCAKALLAWVNSHKTLKANKDADWRQALDALLA